MEVKVTVGVFVQMIDMITTNEHDFAMLFVDVGLFWDICMNGRLKMMMEA